MNSIDIKGISKRFGTKVVLDGLNLQVKKGTILALLGPNGAGKTTTVKLLSTLIKPDEGSATVEGFDLVNESQAVRSTIGLTGQYAALDELLTGHENLMMMGRLYHLPKLEILKRSQELLEQFDLVDAAHKPVKTYSGGMKRKLDLAASLIAQPPVIFLDEPTTGLDPRSRLAMWDIIKKLVESNITILLTTQYLEEADLLADQIAVLDDGRIIAQGTSDELKEKVGKDRLELTIKKNIKNAAELLESDNPVMNKKRNLLSISVNKGTKDITRILDLLEKASISVHSLSLRKPTLDDVFLKLTGKKTETEEDET